MDYGEVQNKQLGSSSGLLSKCNLANAVCFRYRGRVIGTRYGPGSGLILMDDVHCVGHETSIANCYHTSALTHNCDHSEDVSVSCGTSPVHYGINYHSINVFSVNALVGFNASADFV